MQFLTKCETDKSKELGISVVTLKCFLCYT